MSIKMNVPALEKIEALTLTETTDDGTYIVIASDSLDIQVGDVVLVNGDKCSVLQNGIASIAFISDFDTCGVIMKECCIDVTVTL